VTYLRISFSYLSLLLINNSSTAFSFFDWSISLYYPPIPPHLIKTARFQSLRLKIQPTKTAQTAGSTRNSKFKNFMFLSPNSPFLKNPQVSRKFPPRFSVFSLNRERNEWVQGCFLGKSQTQWHYSLLLYHKRLDTLQPWFDWCCFKFYYFKRNSLVALLKALFAWILLIATVTLQSCQSCTHTPGNLAI